MGRTFSEEDYLLRYGPNPDPAGTLPKDRVIYEEWLYLDTSTITYSGSQNLDFSDLNINQWIVKNNGTSICLIDDDPLQPGESKSFGGARKTIYKGRHRLEFTGTGTNNAIFTRIFYVRLKETV